MRKAPEWCFRCYLQDTLSSKLYLQILPHFSSWQSREGLQGGTLPPLRASPYCLLEKSPLHPFSPAQSHFLGRWRSDLCLLVFKIKAKAFAVYKAPALPVRPRSSVSVLVKSSPSWPPATLLPSTAGRSTSRSAVSPGHLQVRTQDLQAPAGRTGWGRKVLHAAVGNGYLTGEPEPSRRTNYPPNWLDNCPFLPHKSFLPHIALKTERCSVASTNVLEISSWSPFKSS